MKIEDLPEVAVVFDGADEMDHYTTTSRISDRTPVGPEMIHAGQRAIDHVGSFVILFLAGSMEHREMF